MDTNTAITSFYHENLSKDLNYTIDIDIEIEINTIDNLEAEGYNLSWVYHWKYKYYVIVQLLEHKKKKK